MAKVLLLLLNTDNLIRPVDIISTNMQAVSSSINEDYGFESLSNNNNASNNNASAVNQSKPQYDVPLSPNDKRRIFYNKILSFIESESPTIYSLLSQGNPIESKGAVLIVALPDHIYDMTQTDKRINDLVAKAIPHFTKNKDVAIQFQKAVEGNMIDKLKSKLQATEVDESSL